jgi:hypothetical protein
MDVYSKYIKSSEQDMLESIINYKQVEFCHFDKIFYYKMFPYGKVKYKLVLYDEVAEFLKNKDFFWSRDIALITAQNHGVKFWFKNSDDLIYFLLKWGNR